MRKVWHLTLRSSHPCQLQIRILFRTLKCSQHESVFQLLLVGAIISGKGRLKWDEHTANFELKWDKEWQRQNPTDNFPLLRETEKPPVTQVKSESSPLAGDSLSVGLWGLVQKNHSDISLSQERSTLWSHWLLAGPHLACIQPLGQRGLTSASRNAFT